MSAALFLMQRLSAMALAVAVIVHLATIITAVRAGLSGSAILARTQGSGTFLAFYALFVVAAAIHAPIGLRTVVREWTPWRDRSLDMAAFVFSAMLFLLGLRAAWAVYAP